MEEIWKDVVGFEGLYEVSNLGNVRNTRTHKFITPQQNRGKKGKSNYGKIHLYSDKKMYHRLVHRLVAEAFIPNPLGLDTVNHINKNQTDNRAENLEWMTVRDNVRYSMSKPVICVETGQIWQCASDACRDFGVNTGMISFCIHHRDGKYKGKTYKYIEEEQA